VAVPALEPVSVRPAAVPVWFLAAVAPMLVSQAVRLCQTDALSWIAWDYAGRIIALAVLAAIPGARRVAFRSERVGIAWWEVLLWVVALLAFDRIVDHAISNSLTAMFPGTRIGQYPSFHEWLFIIDIAFGLALVAYSEEVIFRRCGRAVVADLVGDNSTMVIVTAVMFASYHWWTGIGNMTAAMVFGTLAMLLYRRAGMLLPVVLSHYLCDVLNFS
jgi:hypothetical protein